jgi:hypothetical protein
MPLEDDGFLSEEAQTQAAEAAAEYRRIFNCLKDVNAKGISSRRRFEKR